MCIIIAKNKSDRLPTIEELKTSYLHNNDGGGFMYTNNGKVVIDKGYMTQDAFISHYKKLCKKYNDFNNKCLVIHCRIGTSGTNTKENTHPYALTDSIKLLHTTYLMADVGVAHNGVISDYSYNTGQDTNDTQNYIKDYLFTLYKHFRDFYKYDAILKGIKKQTSSKFAILTKNDELFLIGDFIKDNQLSFSNSTYKTSRYYSYNYNYDDYYYNEDYYTSYYDKYYKNNKTLPKTTTTETQTKEDDASEWLRIPSSYTIETNNEIIKVTFDKYYYNKKDKCIYQKTTSGDLIKFSNDFIVYNASYDTILL